MNDGVCYEIEQLCSEMQHEHSFNQVSMFGNIKKSGSKCTEWLDST